MTDHELRHAIASALRTAATRVLDFNNPLPRGFTDCPIHGFLETDTAREAEDEAQDMTSRCEDDAGCDDPVTMAEWTWGVCIPVETLGDRWERDGLGRRPWEQHPDAITNEP